MAPRHNESNTDYKKKNYPAESNSDADINSILPCLLHKKHKVVKLVKSQLQKIQDEGLCCDFQAFNVETTDDYDQQKRRGDRDRDRDTEAGQAGTSRGAKPSRYVEGEEVETNPRENHKCFCLLFYVTAFLLAVLLLILLVVWISAGPLSNSLTHTPIPAGSFVRTDGLCSLEKKYLLRWSKPEYFE